MTSRFDIVLLPDISTKGSGTMGMFYGVTACFKYCKYFVKTFVLVRLTYWWCLGAHCKE